MGSSANICALSTAPITRHVLTTVLVLLVFLWLSPNSIQGSSVSRAQPAVNTDPNSVENPLVMETEASKRQMLNVLGIDALPKPRQGIVPHQYMMYIYQKMSSRKSMHSGVNTIRGFVDVGDADSSSRPKFHQIYSFNISALPTSEKLISAELRVLRSSTQREWRYIWAHGTSYRATLYYRQKESHVWNGRLYSHTRLKLLGSLMFDIGETGEQWKVFNVIEALRTWKNGTSLLHNFELQVESVRSGYLMPSYMFGLTEKGRAHYKRALLVSFTDDGRVRVPEDVPKKRRRSSKKSKTRTGREDKTETKNKNRVKRDARRRKRRKQLCSRKQLYVDFSLLGWSNWIIAPRGYNAYFCHGYCKFPIPEHLKPTNHAMVQTTVHYVDKRRVPPACCVPHKLSGLSMLFIDKGESVVYKKYDNMVVESCGCK